MPPKRKRAKVQRSLDLSSQSSVTVTVPDQVKVDIKRRQDNKCWLCDCQRTESGDPWKSVTSSHRQDQCVIRQGHRSTSPAWRLTKPWFETNHRFGCIQLHNIHDRRNLVALCKNCHFAFDNNEWTFIPEDTTNWIQKIKAAPGAAPQIIQEYNSQRNTVFRCLLLDLDPDSESFKDIPYRSAFTKNPTKMWPGEPGVVIMRPSSFGPSPNHTAELTKTLNDFRALQVLWVNYKGSCLKENCPICQSNSDGKQRNKDSEDDKDDEDDQEDEDDNGDDDSNEEDGGENEEGNDDISSSGKSRNRESRRRRDSTARQPFLQDVDAKKSTHARKHRKVRKNTERDWMTSTPYDESIPYSHRYGYTWAGSTSNQIMQMWQAYRKPAHD